MTATKKMIEQMAEEADFWHKLVPHRVPSMMDMRDRIMESPDIERVVQQDMENMDREGSIVDAKAATATLLSIYYTMQTWAFFGKNLFDLQGDLAAAMLLTDPPAQPIQLPYPSIMIRVPDRVIPFFERNTGRQGWATLIHVALSDRTLLLSANSANDGSLYSAFDADTGEVCLEGKTAFLADNRAQLVDADKLTYSAAIRVVANLASWLEGHPAEKQSPQRRKQSRKRKKDRPWPTVWITGNEVKLSGEMRGVAAEFALGGRAEKTPGWKLRMQRLVRGHWKKQAHGPRHSLRKLIRVEPYLRGPEAKVAWSHVYDCDRKGD